VGHAIPTGCAAGAFLLGHLHFLPPLAARFIFLAIKGDFFCISQRAPGRQGLLHLPERLRILSLPSRAEDEDSISQQHSVAVGQ